MAAGDPLMVLPPELVLRILEFTPTSSLASLTTTTKGWHQFIDVTHQEAIYSVYSKPIRPIGSEDPADTTSFSRYLEGATSSKELCKRQTLLSGNWTSDQPSTTESVLQIGNGPVWRFRPDFKRRFFVSTSQAGGFNVTDMDSGKLLWRLPSTLQRDQDSVRPYAHLEYEDGMAVFDREGNALEVWQTGLDGLRRGEFKRLAVLPHERQTRGFQLSGGTLCVASTEGEGLVYDMRQQPPRLTRRMVIAEDAVGHLYQDAGVVMYSMGERGYHFYDKHSGDSLGILKPGPAVSRYHIPHPDRAPEIAQHGSTARPFAPSMPRQAGLVPLTVKNGPLMRDRGSMEAPLAEDEWGAGALDGKLMVGFSRAGRVYICPDWRQALQHEGHYEHSAVIECEYGNTDFDLGGWLSVRNHRVMFEVRDFIYIVALDDEDNVQRLGTGSKIRPSYAYPSYSASQLAEPVSFMALFDDCVMSTHGTLGWRIQDSNITAGDNDSDPDEENAAEEGPARIFPTKMIRTLSFAPQAEPPRAALWEASSSTPSSSSISRESTRAPRYSQTELQRVVSLLDEDDGEDRELQALAALLQLG
ncbi:hypothetical protein B0A55_06347 [Friedmanniomyces simplex]|uniref:F-box domain-containing protein n=1 Tax=Friedmanniomyces simplex TaxID=329884 RepID=A0A4U0XHJ1_9PEZI|nr:hypothetical protein B0A55_06347 [Friedmanniomyces simplex]